MLSYSFCLKEERVFCLSSFHECFSSNPFMLSIFHQNDLAGGVPCHYFSHRKLYESVFSFYFGPSEYTLILILMWMDVPHNNNYIYPKPSLHGRPIFVLRTSLDVYDVNWVMFKILVYFRSSKIYISLVFEVIIKTICQSPKQQWCENSQGLMDLQN